MSKNDCIVLSAAATGFFIAISIIAINANSDKNIELLQMERILKNEDLSSEDKSALIRDLFHAETPDNG